MVWRQGRSSNGDVMVFDNIETFVSFSSVWDVCVAIGHRMIVWQGNYQMNSAEGCAVVQISRMVFGFQFQRDWEDWFLDVCLRWKYKKIRYTMYSTRQSFYLKVGFVG
jgi:hypothetical protein